MASNISDSLLRGPPRGATVHRIDFEKTSPPIPSFKDRFAAVIDDFMTEAECKDLLRLAEESINPPIPDADADPSRTHTSAWERAMINVGGGRQVMSVDTRKSGRIILDSGEIAQRLLDRLMPFLRDFHIDVVKNQPLVTGLGPARRGESFHISQLNERLRFLRYDGGDYFRPHWDGCYVTPDGKERSLFTIHLYLNGDGEQDLAELLPEIERAEKKHGLFAKNGEVDLMEIATEEAEPSTPAPASALESLRSQGKLLGGATSFTDGYSAKEAVRVFPRTGSVLLFQQRNLMHAGDDVFRGVKYTMRTDVMYTNDSS
ncbi:Prolyl 4-hydroxylase alpha subunit [Penicillium hispanicum]|uniref:Prolyl 4-hydroxylase alpha subunit n=1 Tax=Penicillium hispanicum TaxID=1080232 RepID=UPI002540D4ED|nr:Prolyl 4-hydroxylase alpha subunit [Penicillium hispanicum]KAJ5580076.1 Prolyl 4-hydroxylase alpha subunit [Penicillium hispanicum]